VNILNFAQGTANKVILRFQKGKKKENWFYWTLNFNTMAINFCLNL